MGSLIWGITTECRNSAIFSTRRLNEISLPPDEDSMPTQAYLDWNATGPLRPEAQAAVIAAMAVTGNPSSVHANGRAARRLLETAREQVAALVGAASRDVVFTSG